jgi:hypothetical protein
MLIAKKAVIWHHIFYNIVTFYYLFKITIICIIQNCRIRVLCSFNVVTNDDLSKLLTLTSGSKKNRDSRKKTHKKENTTLPWGSKLLRLQ